MTPASLLPGAPVTDDTVVVGPVYMAGPITPTEGRTLAQNIDQAVATLAYLTRRRVAAICPQLTGHIPADVVPYEDWMEVDFLLVESSLAVLALPGWDTSAGTRRELLHAAEKGIPVFYTVRALFDALGVLPRAARPIGAPPAPPAPSEGIA